jgi:hypothetical protein
VYEIYTRKSKKEDYVSGVKEFLNLVPTVAQNVLLILIRKVSFLICKYLECTKNTGNTDFVAINPFSQILKNRPEVWQSLLYELGHVLSGDRLESDAEDPKLRG